MTQLTEQEHIILDRLEKYLFETGCSHDMVVSMLKLIFEYNQIGSASHIAHTEQVTQQYINRICPKATINGVTIYFNRL